MNMDFRIYEAGTNLNPDGWPDNVVDPDSSVVYSLSGVRPKRMNITEYWDGKDNNGNMKPDGVYPYVLKVYSTARGDQNPIYSTDRTYGYITISRGQILFNKFDVYPTIPTTYNSSEAVHLPPYSIEYSLSRQSTVTVRVVDWLSPSIVYADVILGENRDANTQYTDYWDGKCTRNVGGEHPCTKYDFVADGSYKIQVVAEDADQIQALRQPATAFKVIDVAPLKIFDVSIREVGPDTPGVISYQVSEPMKVVTKIYEPGTNITGFQEPNGLVKRLIGVRSARTPVNEIWDGTDLSMFPVDDGTYVFSIFGTTVTSAVNGFDGGITGDIRMDYDTELYNLPSAYTIPVARGGSIDVCGSFENDSYFAPNPYTGNNGWFRIPVKAIGNVTLKIYNLAGDLVYSKDYGKRGADESINGKGKCNASHTHEACWPKVNNSGRELARGVYFAVLRFEAAEGSKAVCQTVKKILIP
jgi:flagellar hook assembly protein FlgD